MLKLFKLAALVAVVFIGLSIMMAIGVAIITPDPDPAATAAAEAQAEADAELIAKRDALRAEIARMDEEDRAAAEAAKPQMNLANYNRCQPGMTYAEVVAIVGPPDEELSSSKIAGISTVMYQWSGGIVANANMMFQDGKLIQKAKFGF